MHIEYLITSSELCKDMFFDRTKNLNGYRIRAAAKINDHHDRIIKKADGLITRASDIRQVTAVLALDEGLLSKALVYYLDVSIEITHAMLLSINLDSLELPMRGIIEIDLIPTTLINDNEVFDTMNYIHPSYPFFFIYEKIVTHNRGLATPLEKMFEFYGWLSIIVTSIILLVGCVVIYLSKSVNSSNLLLQSPGKK
ncbi:hypothetical protein KQX54_014864 [Cotesia glomerata]|uniref:Uncharacterized protein n=1 Tax=Cotesia glomerata TaxID=32391 RepID=A0AAV7IN13_COTGL|nr:hypothetical protein KQX54_014864 [Cotesia glomerata]